MINFAKGYVRYLGDGGMKPATRTEGLLYQALFAAAMAFSMVLSVNLLLLSHDTPTSVSMLAGWPVWFAFAFLLRELYANRVACYVRRRWLERLNGPLQQVLFVAVNVVLMAPVLCAAGVESGLLLGGVPHSAFLATYVHMLPRASVLAFALVIFAVKPFASAMFSHAVSHLSSPGRG